jgi:uncharacterized membrane protein
MELNQLHQSVAFFGTSVPVIRAVLGFILVFFLPGFAWSFILFHKINNLERVALSIGLSIALVTLAVLVLNVLFHIRINGLNTVITIIIMTAIPAAIYLFKRLHRHKSEVSLR